MSVALPGAGAAGLWRRVGLWSRRHRLSSVAAVVLAVAATASGLATYGALTRTGPYGPDAESVIVLLIADLVFLALLGVVLARRLVVLWGARRRGRAGSQLHARLVSMFAMAAVLPAVVVGVFSALFLTLGVDAWFSERVRTALDESAAVSRAYLDEHADNVRAHVIAMARDIDRAGPAAAAEPLRFSRLLEAQALLRELSEAIVFRRDGHILGQTSLSFSLALYPVTAEELRRAASGEAVMTTGADSDRVRALIALDSQPDTFLHAGRLVDPIVIGHSARVAEAAQDFRVLDQSRADLQIAFALVYVTSALLLLFVAIWFALQFATRLAEPISALMGAAERVRAGDLTARVPDRRLGDELGALSRAFNRMTRQLATQRSELVDANRQLDARRRFTESVLSGVSAGVIGLDAEGRVELPNRRALELLRVGRDELVGHRLAGVVAELAPLIDEAFRAGDGRAEGDVTLTRNGHTTNLMVRIGSERGGGTPGGARTATGYVVTFDDMTQLVAAQRKAAWAEMARRLAHEIKNPLTPIQLSAERLKRKYGAQIAKDRDVFVACTDTIVRQVGDLRDIVDEFSDFARLPRPRLVPADAVALVDDAIALHDTAPAGIVFRRESLAESLPIRCDRRQIGQVLNNLIKNAMEAIADRAGGGLPRGRIRIVLASDGKRCAIDIHDNGRGLPAGARDALFEPYVTHRDQGTGLGLAIARRIVTEHGGRLTLGDSPDGGACARIELPSAPVEPASDNGAAGDGA